MKQFFSTIRINISTRKNDNKIFHESKNNNNFDNYTDDNFNNNNNLKDVDNYTYVPA